MGNLKNEVTIRQATRNDVNAIYIIQNNLFAYTAQSKADILNKITSSLYKVYVAQYKKKVVGYSIIVPRSSKYNGMTLAFKTAIDKDYQKQGIASKMVDETLKDYDHVVCHVRHTNSDSLALRKAKGFKVVCRIPNYYSNHDTAIRLYRCKDGVRSRQNQLIIYQSKQNKHRESLKQNLRDIVKQMIIDLKKESK